MQFFIETNTTEPTQEEIIESEKKIIDYNFNLFREKMIERQRDGNLRIEINIFLDHFLEYSYKYKSELYDVYYNYMIDKIKADDELLLEFL